MKQMKFRNFLESKFIEWQNKTGKRRTIGEFAQFIGVRQSTLSTWWNTDVIPSGESVRLLASKLGAEIYDALGLPRPNENLFYIQQNWDNLPPEQQRALREQAEKYIAKNDRSKKD
jgi:transcriptional regulator with XRE-family HTH domain